MSDVQDEGGHEAADEKSVAEAQELTDARRVGKSQATVGSQDLRDAETFRALREQEEK